MKLREDRTSNTPSSCHKQHTRRIQRRQNAAQTPEQRRQNTANSSHCFDTDPPVVLKPVCVILLHRRRRPSWVN
ncbi:hypothetical protein OROMI_002271 [Orobanche minor]